jgi:amino acid transporter
MTAQTSGPTGSTGASGSTSSTGGQGGKGLRDEAIGLVSSVVIGVSSTAPGYSIAATLGFVVAIVGFQAPVIMVLAFVPMLFIAYAYRELNRVAPDCGTTFTWAAKAFGPRTGWMGGWGIIAADVVVMASLAQIAGIYGFLLFGADGLAASTFWTTVVGCLWIAALTYVCYRGIEVSAIFQTVMLAVEAVVLVIFAITALIRVYSGHALAGAVHPQLSWFNPLNIPSFSAFSSAILLAVFIYWGWDSAVAVNEETRDKEHTPGRAAIISTVLLLLIYAIVSIACISFGGVANLKNQDDVLAVLGGEVLGNNWAKLLIFCVLTSAAASTQTTILPTARATLSMAAYQALPPSFAKMHKKYQTPTVSTIAMGLASIGFFVAMAAVSDNILADSASAVGLLIAFYYGMTGFTSAWYFRDDRGHGLRELNARIILPLLGGLMLLAAFVRTVFDDYNPDNSETVINVFGLRMGGIFVIAVGSLIIGVILMYLTEARSPAYFRGEVLNRETPVLVVEGEPLPVGLTLPDSASTEHTVIPPLSVEELRRAEDEARRRSQGGDDQA